MDLVLWVYLAEVLSVCQGLQALAIIGTIAALMYKGLAISEKWSQGAPNTALTVALLLCLWALFVPSKQGMYTLMAAYGVDQVVQSEDVQRVASKSLAVLEQRMDEYLGEKDESP